MNETVFSNPALTIALALAVGMSVQVLAHHLRVPGIVLLLAAGVALGPDAAGIIRPDSLGPALGMLTGFAVAIILFEGALNLKFARLKRAHRSIRQLVLLGGFVTVIGAAVAVHFILHWPWETSILFGTLVMVTGPTVINPLLKRLNVKRSVATVLEAEGVLIDAVGAVVAIVALEAVLSPDHNAPLVWGWHVVSRLGFGAVFGGGVGLLLVLLFRLRRLIPEGIENVFTLSVVLALFQGSNLLLPESGIAAVTMAGIVTGNLSSNVLSDLMKFKEELTVLLIGVLFVLLAADVRVTEVLGLGWPAVGVVLVLMLLVRPAAVLAGTAYSNLGWRERVFISWIGPRGIVAAAVASFFAAAFAEKGLPGGNEMRALVFLVIAVTVLTAGFTGGLVASLLRLRRRSNDGWIILGASSLARGMAKLFKEDGQVVICLDTNADHCRAAETDCTRIIYGNGLKAKYLLLAEIDTRSGALALTSNDEVNYLFAQTVRDESRHVLRYAALKSDTASLTLDMLQDAGVECLFGAPTDVELWNRRIDSRQVRVEHWRCRTDPPAETVGCALFGDHAGRGLIAAALRRNGRLSPIGHRSRFRADDEVCFFVYEPEHAAVGSYLSQMGWQHIDSTGKDEYSTSTCDQDELPASSSVG